MGLGCSPRRRAAAGGQLEKLVIRFLRFDRLWWWLAVLAVVALLGQEIAKSSAFVVAAEFEGFGDELEDDVEDDSDEPFVVPPPVHPKPGFQNDRGPPASKASSSAEQKTTEKEEDLVGEWGEEVDEDEAFVATPSPPVKKASEQFWDEDEFEGLPEDSAEEREVSPEKERRPENTGDKPPKSRPKPSGPQSYWVEVICITFIIAYLFVYYFGRKTNEKIALAWAAQYAGKDSVFEKNFSLLGTGDGLDSPLLIKEGQNIFKFYASGRRYCEGLLAIMDLQSRHDLIARIWYLISPRKDEITIDVFMNEENMDPIVFALARKKNAKSMHKDVKDLNQFATILSPPAQRRWVTDELSVISESRELATDLLTDALLDQVFGEKSFPKHASNFVSLHFTDQHSEGSHKKILQFKFTVPPVDRIAEMTRLISVVTHFIDAVGRYKISPQARSKSQAARAKIAQEAFKENQASRQEALLKKKEERRKALDDAENSKLTPEALRRKEEKERLRQVKKSMPKVKMTRVR